MFGVKTWVTILKPELTEARSTFITIFVVCLIKLMSLFLFYFLMYIICHTNGQTKMYKYIPKGSYYWNFIEWVIPSPTVASMFPCIHYLTQYFNMDPYMLIFCVFVYTIDLCFGSWSNDPNKGQSSEMYYIDDNNDAFYQQYSDNSGCYGSPSFKSEIHLNGSIFESETYVYGFSEYYDWNCDYNSLLWNNCCAGIQWNINNCVEMNANFSIFAECIDNEPFYYRYNNSNCNGIPYQNISVNVCEPYGADPAVITSSVNNPCNITD